MTDQPKIPEIAHYSDAHGEWCAKLHKVRSLTAEHQNCLIRYRIEHKLGVRISISDVAQALRQG